jgi:hypothetical protein
MQQAHYGPPASPPQPPPTVQGLPLAPGERVVFYEHDDGAKMRILFIVLGVLTLVAFIGVIFLIIAFTSKSETIAITTQRIIKIEGKVPTFFVHGQTARMVRVMKGGNHRIELYDAQQRQLSFYVRGNDALRETLMRFVENPQLTHHAPTVRYDA